MSKISLISASEMCWAGAGRGGGGQVSSISSIGPGKGEEIGVMCPGSGRSWPPPGRWSVAGLTPAHRGTFLVSFPSRFKIQILSELYLLENYYFKKILCRYHELVMRIASKQLINQSSEKCVNNIARAIACSVDSLPAPGVPAWAQQHGDGRGGEGGGGAEGRGLQAAAGGGGRRQAQGHGQGGASSDREVGAGQCKGGKTQYLEKPPCWKLLLVLSHLRIYILWRHYYIKWAF